MKMGRKTRNLGAGNAQGLGTITYLDSDSHFGALGHGIHDIDTGELLNISDGTLYLTSVKEIQKGVNGTPGGMEGIIVYNNYNVLGKIKKNTEAGIFGTIDRVDVLFANQTPVQLAKKEEVEEGPAIIRCAVDGEIKEYDILITQVNLWSGEVNKSMTIEVTDPSLLDETAGSSMDERQSNPPERKTNRRSNSRFCQQSDKRLWHFCRIYDK